MEDEINMKLWTSNYAAEGLTVQSDSIHGLLSSGYGKQTTWTRKVDTLEKLEAGIMKSILDSTYWAESNIDDALALDWFRSGMTIEDYKVMKRGKVRMKKFGI